MKHYMISLLITFSTLTTSAQQLTSFKLMDKPPALTVEKWIQGEPVTTFEKGTIYVVEFTATWCPGCLNAIPDLNKLAKRYPGVVNVISIYTKTDIPLQDHQLRIKKVMEKYKGEMDFNIAIDQKDATSGAYKVKGLPTAFIIDKKGQVVWFGNPHNGLDQAVFDLINNKLEPEVAMKKESDASDFRAVLVKSANKDYRPALKSIDSLLLLEPNEKILHITKFQILAGNNDILANAWLKKMLDNNQLHFDWLRMSDYACRLPKEPDYELAVAAIAKAKATAPEYVHPGLFQRLINMFLQKAMNSDDKTVKRAALENALKECDKAIEFCRLNHATSREEQYQNSLKYIKKQLDTLKYQTQ